MIKSVATFLLIVLLAQTSFADIYKWVDEKGHIHYSDKKPENQVVEKVVVEVNSYESVSYGTARVDTPEVSKTNRVVMLSASWCGYCKQARSYFRQNKIRFTEYDIEKSSRGQKLYRQLDARGVPVILVGKQRMNGFSPAGFERIYR